MRKIDKIIVHCSATKEGFNYSVETIRSWHKMRGWSDVGYHYIVHLDGSISYGRDINKSGAHVKGHNTGSIGVCYIGGVEADGKTPKDTRTPEQKESLLDLIKTLKRLNSNAVVYGHRDFSSKACPSYDATTEYKDV
jgi:N-acetylmuramoyl-L-alanine amidase